jgi:hypothetical protein
MLHAQEQRTLIPGLPPLPPVDARFLQRLEGALTTTVTDISFRTAIGQQVSVARLEVTADPTAAGADPRHVRLIRIVRPSFISPVDTITTPFDPFVAFPGPSLRIDRLVIEDGTIGTLAHPSQFEGRWLWLQRNVDIDVQDIRIGGDAPESMRLVRADMTGELRGQPLRITHAEAAITRGGDVLDVGMATGLGDSELVIDGMVRRSGAFQFDLAAMPLSFAEARAFVHGLPAEGGAQIDATIAGGDSPLSVALRHVVAHVRESVVAASGTVQTGAGGAVHDLTVDIQQLVSADLDTLYGISLPGGGVWKGSVRADGPLETGVSFVGLLERADQAVATAGTTSATRVDAPRVAVEGTFRTDGDGPRRVAVAGDVVVRLGAAEDGAIREVAAHAEGTAVLAGGGSVNGRIVADSVPLDLLPLPAAIDSVRGAMHANIDVAGTFDAPVLSGIVDVRGGAFRIPAARLAIDELAGPIVVADGVATLDALCARANGGTVDVRGSVRLTGGARTADAAIAVSDVVLLDNDSISVFAAGDLRATGALMEPRIAADIRLTSTRTGASPLAFGRGTLDLARGGALDFELRADSLPLAALPTTAAVRDVRGGVRALVHVTGTIAEPATEGRIDLRGAGGYVVRTGTDVSDIRGSALVRDGRIVFEDVTGSVGGGALAIEGEARFADRPRTLSARATVARGRIVDTDSAQVVASADVRAEGALDRPHIDGTVTLHEGWVHEDNFARRQPLDPADPPYEVLIERVPWLVNSRLRTGAARPLITEEPAAPEPVVRPPAPDVHVAESLDTRDGPRFVARIAINLEPGFLLIDEDSEIDANGRIVLVVDSAGARAEGLYRLTAGYYAQYGSIFDIRGGAFYFTGDGFTPRVSMRSEHRFQAPLGIWLTPGPRVFDRFPPLEFFAFGSQNAASESVRRLSFMPESRTELGAFLLYDDEPQLVTGLETRQFWPPDDGGGVFGESSATRGIVLLWSYIANESYDYLPLERAYMRAGTIMVGPETPGRITIAPYLQGGIRFGALHAIVTQPAERGTAPGVRLRYRIGAPDLLAFSEPFFRSTPPLGPGGPVFSHRRRTGIGIHWSWEW